MAMKPQDYKGNGNHKWERVTSNGDTQRLRVPGGWIYVAASTQDGQVIDTNAVFVPIPVNLEKFI